MTLLTSVLGAILLVLQIIGMIQQIKSNHR
jgi:hypothetical protein